MVDIKSNVAVFRINESCLEETCHQGGIQYLYRSHASNFAVTVGPSSLPARRVIMPNGAGKTAGWQGVP